MAALAYLVLPITGLVAFLRGSSPRVRFHGLQAIMLGLIWPAALWVAAFFPPTFTRGVFFVGAIGWLGFLIATAVGANPRIPIVGAYFERAAEGEIKAAPRNTSDRTSPSNR